MRVASPLAGGCLIRCNPNYSVFGLFELSPSSRCQGFSSKSRFASSRNMKLLPILSKLILPAFFPSPIGLISNPDAGWGIVNDFGPYSGYGSSGKWSKKSVFKSLSAISYYRFRFIRNWPSFPCGLASSATKGTTFFFSMQLPITMLYLYYSWFNVITIQPWFVSLQSQFRYAIRIIIIIFHANSIQLIVSKDFYYLFIRYYSLPGFVLAVHKIL